MTDMHTWTTPAGWYPDAERPGHQRYWDGQQWTEHMAPLAEHAIANQQPAVARGPMYKRPWFIVAAVVLGLAVLAGSVGGSEPPQSAEPVADIDAASGTSASADAAEGDGTLAADEPAEIPSVPDVIGLDQTEASAELEAVGFDVLVRRIEREGAARGEVVGQSPGSGTDADEGSSVTIEVATGVISAKVPDVTGRSVAAGTKSLRGKGFTVDVSKVEDDSVAPGQILAQSPRGEAEKGSMISLTVAKAPKPVLTSGQENALRTADDYLAYTAFSREGLIEQLEFEGYSTADATFAVDYLNVNWKEQAAQSARNYLDMSGFSRSGLIQQLEFEGYTTKQATYGVDQAM